MQEEERLVTRDLVTRGGERGRKEGIAQEMSGRRRRFRSKRDDEARNKYHSADGDSSRLLDACEGG